MKRLLLHACCAPCVPYVYFELASSYDVSLFFSNANIQPLEEYSLRLDEIKRFSEINSIELFIDKYGADEWNNAVSNFEDEPEGGRRCEVCFSFRLNRTANKAAELGFDLLTTTLTVSPHKNSKLINEIGRRVSEPLGVVYLISDFKKKDGFKKSVEMSKPYDFYRQDYCGCIHSRRK